MNLDRLKDLMLNDSGFAFDPRTGLTYNISVTGLDIIRWLNEGSEENQIVARLGQDYEVDELTAQRDFDAFVSSLQGLGLLSTSDDEADEDEAIGEPEPVAESSDD